LTLESGSLPPDTSISKLMDSRKDQHFVHLPSALLDAMELKTNFKVIKPSNEFGKYNANGFGVLPDLLAAIASAASE